MSTWIRFPCLQLAREVSGKSQSLLIALNAANEVAVAAFLDERIRFTDIPVIINDVLEQTTDQETSTIEAVIDQDGEARKLAFRKVKKIQ